MPGTTPKQQRLAAVPMFRACSPEELRRIERVADEVQVPAGRRIVGQGDVGREFFIVESGTVEVRRDGRVIATLGAGEHFGELALLGVPARIADVVAVTDVDLVVLGTREFMGLLQDVPHMAISILRALAVRFAEREQDR